MAIHPHHQPHLLHHHHHLQPHTCPGRHHTKPPPRTMDHYRAGSACHAYIIMPITSTSHHANRPHPRTIHATHQDSPPPRLQFSSGNAAHRPAASATQPTHITKLPSPEPRHTPTSPTRDSADVASAGVSLQRASRLEKVASRSNSSRLGGVLSCFTRFQPCRNCTLSSAFALQYAFLRRVDPSRSLFAVEPQQQSRWPLSGLARPASLAATQRDLRPTYLLFTHPNLNRSPSTTLQAKNQEHQLGATPPLALDPFIVYPFGHDSFVIEYFRENNFHCSHYINTSQKSPREGEGNSSIYRITSPLPKCSTPQEDL